ncbi:MAG: DUF2520 domain-containing protein [Rickettsiales bacterium]|nr:DUF2520 domain-containing protein [Rickettsiales bacterium]
MRQVPHYLIIGNGRVAKHLCYYFDYLNLSYSNWYRNKDKNNLQLLKSLLNRSSHIILLITDSQIDSFIERYVPHSIQKNRVLLHCSGNLLSKYAFTAHPLQTFSSSLYDFENYLKIPFIIELEGPTFSELLPRVSNPHYRIKRLEKHYYHALCVAANNFTTLLWQKFFLEAENKFQIKKQSILPFLKQTFANLEQDHLNALTGPLVRNDKKTLDDDLQALQGENFYNIFKVFIETFYKGI